MKVRLMAGQVEYLPMGQAKSKSRYCNDKKGNLRSRYCVSLNDQRVHISCQDLESGSTQSLRSICEPRRVCMIDPTIESQTGDYIP